MPVGNNSGMCNNEAASCTPTHFILIVQVTDEIAVSPESLLVDWVTGFSVALAVLSIVQVLTNCDNKCDEYKYIYLYIYLSITEKQSVG